MARATKKSVDAPVVAEPVVATPPPAPVEEETTSVEEVDNFAVVSEKLATVTSELKSIVALVKTLQKENAKLKKLAAKKTRKPSANRGLSGFAKPTKLSNELCAFLGVPAGTELARTEVTRKLNEYIKSNNLQDAKDRRKIVPDAKLKKLIAPEYVNNLSFFVLQSAIKGHFVKASA